MKGILSIFFSLIIVFSVFAQNTKSSLRSREVIIQKGDTLIRVTILAGNLNLKPSLNRIYFYYSKGMINSNIGDYGGNLLNGEYKAFFNSKLIESGHFNRGCKTGVWESWYMNGKFKKINSWKNGVLSGSFSYYNVNGIIEEQGYYKNARYKTSRTSVKKDSIVLDTPKRKVKRDHNLDTEKSSKKSEKK